MVAHASQHRTEHQQKQCRDQAERGHHRTLKNPELQHVDTFDHHSAFPVG
jgi:hypothetical protein